MFAETDYRIGEDDNSAFHGNVMVHYLGVWGSVCYDGWDYNDALVVCRYGGHSNNMPALKIYSSIKFNNRSKNLPTGIYFPSTLIKSSLSS